MVIDHKSSLLEILFQQTQVGVFEFDTQLIIKRFNTKFVEIIHSDANRLTNFDIKKSYDQRLLPLFQRILKGEKAYYEGEYIPTTSPTPVYIRIELFPLFNHEKNIVGGIGIISDITQTTQEEKKTDEIELIIKNLLTGITVGVGIISLTGKPIFINTLFEQITGYRLRELTTAKFMDIVHPEFQSLVRESLNLVKLTKSPCNNLEIKLLTKNNTEKWVSFGINIITLKDNDFFLITATDITKHRWLEEELNVQKSFFETLFNASPDAITVLDPDDRILQINQRFTEMFGYTPEEALGAQINDLIVPEELKDEGIFLTNTVSSGKDIVVETIRKDKFGNPKNVSIIGKPINYGSNRIAVYGIYRDITTQKHLELIRNILFDITNAVYATETINEYFDFVHKRLSDVLNVDNFFVALIDEYHNEYYFAYLKDTQNRDLIESRISLNEPYNLINEVIQTKQPLLLDEKMINYKLKNSGIKEALPVSWIGVPLKIKDKVIGVLGVQSYSLPNLYNEEDKQILINVSGPIATAVERKIAEEALRDSEEKYRLLVESSIDGIIISQHGKFIYVNQAFAEMLGYSVEELQGKEFTEIYTSKALATLNERDKLRKSGVEPSPIYETTFRKKDGSEIDVEIHVTIIEYKGEKATFAIIRDITERKKILAQLLADAKKVEKLGNLIPICASCKKIRDDSHPEKPWIDPEIYITERIPEINFTHGICPTCLKKLYPSFYQKKKNSE